MKFSALSIDVTWHLKDPMEFHIDTWCPTQAMESD